MVWKCLHHSINYYQYFIDCFSSPPFVGLCICPHLSWVLSFLSSFPLSSAFSFTYSNIDFVCPLSISDLYLPCSLFAYAFGLSCSLDSPAWDGLPKWSSIKSGRSAWVLCLVLGDDGIDYFLSYCISGLWVLWIAVLCEEPALFLTNRLSYSGWSNALSIWSSTTSFTTSVAKVVATAATSWFWMVLPSSVGTIWLTFSPMKLSASAFKPYAAFFLISSPKQLLNMSKHDDLL